MPNITITSLEGQSFSAYCAMPKDGHGPGLLVIPEILGVNDVMRSVCDDYAAQGYVVLCPDLFWRQEAGVQLSEQSQADWEHAIALYKGFDTEAGIRDLLSTLGAIRSMPECNGKIGTVGYCLGGRLAFFMAARSDVDATVSFYGVEIEKYLDEVHDIRMPTLLHIAEQDEFVPADVRAKILRRTDRNPVITPYVYDGALHAFARPGGKNFNAEAAELANRRTREFLVEQLLS